MPVPAIPMPLPEDAKAEGNKDNDSLALLQLPNCARKPARKRTQSIKLSQRNSIEHSHERKLEEDKELSAGEMVSYGLGTPPFPKDRRDRPRRAAVE